MHRNAIRRVRQFVTDRSPGASSPESAGEFGAVELDKGRPAGGAGQGRPRGKELSGKGAELGLAGVGREARGPGGGQPGELLPDDGGVRAPQPALAKGAQDVPDKGLGIRRADPVRHGLDPEEMPPKFGELQSMGAKKVQLLDEQRRGYGIEFERRRQEEALALDAASGKLRQEPLIPNAFEGRPPVEEDEARGSLEYGIGFVREPEEPPGRRAGACRGGGARFRRRTSPGRRGLRILPDLERDSSRPGCRRSIRARTKGGFQGLR